MSVVGILALTVWLWRERLFRIAVLISAGIAISVIVYLVGSGNTRVASVIQSGLDIFRFTGGSDDIRAALYASAFEILKTSPIVGVGLGQIMVTAESQFPQLVAGTGLENLHADWANFAAMAGALGLLAWLLLLAAPLLLLVDRRARQDRPIVLGVILLTTGQFTLGVSNATFGILPQTVIYAVALPTHYKTQLNQKYVRSDDLLPFIYPSIVEQLDGLAEPGVLLLVAGGLVGKIFIGRARARGAVVLDMGHVVDDWSNGRLPSLR